MVVHFSYQLKFPFGAEFNQCPKYLIYRQLFQQIKKLTCINTLGSCKECSYQNECIYHHISGQNFSFYPGLFIKRNTIEKRKYSNKQLFQMDLYLFHGLIQYEGYIRAFFEETNLLFQHFYQIVSFKKNILKEGILCSGNVKLVTPIKDYPNFALQTEYYNQNYLTNFVLPHPFSMTKEQKVVDEQRYLINQVRIQLGGMLGILEVSNLDEIFFEIGIGKTNYLGGGAIHAITNQTEIKRD